MRSEYRRLLEMMMAFWIEWGSWERVAGGVSGEFSGRATAR
jgi:hypothetical protein